MDASKLQKLNSKMLSDEDQINLLHDIDAAFSRKFTFRPVPVENSTKFLNEIVPHGVAVWSDSELQELKKQLNDVKSLLSGIDIVPWSAHTCSTHRAGYVREHMRRQFHAELCTQAWCKFYEVVSSFPDIVNTIPLLSKENGKDCHVGTDNLSGPTRRFSSLHLCEAPGAFITSLNHYLHSHGFDKSQWHWLASTLNPYYEGNSLSSMINDDSFIRDTQDHWMFGEDNTGNIMNERNLRALQLSCKEKGLSSIHLITADGSVDCADDPAEQESIVSRLHFHEILAALHLLTPEGSFVLKMFTLFESISVFIIHLLRCLFERVHAMKPVTSKPGNSEVYIISTGFKGAPASLLQYLSVFIYSSDLSLHTPVPRSALSETFMDEHRECCRRFADWQMSTIRQNVETFQKLRPKDNEKLEMIKEYFVKAFLDRYPIVDLNRNDRIAPISSSAYRQRMFVNSTEFDKSSEECRSKLSRKVRSKWVRVHRSRHAGTFIERKQLMNQTWQEKLSQLNLFSIDDVLCTSEWSEQRSDPGKRGESWAEIIRGKALSEICSSKFCEHQLLQTYCSFISNVPAELCDHQPLSAELAQQLFQQAQSGAIVTMLSFDELCREPQTSVADTRQLLVYGDLTGQQLLHSAVCALDGRDLIKLIDLLQILPVGSHLVASTRVMLTRLSAAALRLICLLFTQVSTVRRGELPVWHIVAVGYTGAAVPGNLNVAELTKELRSDIDYQLQPSTKTVESEESSAGPRHRILSVLSTHRLCEHGFLSFIRKSNDDFMILRMNHLMKQLKPVC